MPPLKNLKQEQFCLNYIGNGNNATKAYKDAYKCKADIARRSGSRLLSNVDVKKRLKELIEPMLEDKEQQAQTWVKQVSEHAASDIKEVMEEFKIDVPGEEDEEGSTETHYRLKPFEKINGRLIQSIEPTKEGYKVKLYDKMKAHDMMGRYLALFKEKVEVDLSDDTKRIFEAWEERQAKLQHGKGNRKKLSATGSD